MQYESGLYDESNIQPALMKIESTSGIAKFYWKDGRKSTENTNKKQNYAIVDIFKLQTVAENNRKKWIFVDRIFYSFNSMLYAQSLVIEDPKAQENVSVTTGKIGAVMLKNSTDITIFEQGYCLLRKNIELKSDTSSITTFNMNQKGLFNQLSGTTSEKALILSVSRKFEAMYRDSQKKDVLNNPQVETLSGYYQNLKLLDVNNIGNDRDYNLPETTTQKNSYFLFTDQNKEIYLRSKDNKTDFILKASQKYVMVGDYLVMLDSKQLQIHYCSQYFFIQTTNKGTTKVPKLIDSISKRAQCYPVTVTINTESSNWEIIKTFNFENSIIFVLHQSGSDRLYRFDKHTLKLDFWTVNQNKHIDPNRFDVVEYKEHLLMAYMFPNSKKLQIAKTEDVQSISKMKEILNSEISLSDKVSDISRCQFSFRFQWEQHLLLQFSTFCSITDSSSKISDYEFKIGQYFVYKSENLKTDRASMIKNSIMKNLIDVTSNKMKDYKPLHSCILGDWVYFVPEIPTTSTQTNDTIKIIVENPLQNSWYKYNMEDDTGLKTIDKLVCLRNHIAVIGTCHDNFNKLTDKTKEQSRIVILSHGGESSYLYNRLLTSHNFAENIDKPKVFKHISESKDYIFVTYTEKESAKNTTEGKFRTLVLNKHGPQAYMKIIVNFNKTDDGTQKTMEATTLSLNSFTNNNNSNNRPISLNFETLKHEILLTKQNKTIKNKVLRRQNFTRVGISYIENFLNVTGPIFNMYVAKTTSKATSSDKNVLKVFPEKVSQNYFTFVDRISEENLVNIPLSSTEFPDITKRLTKLSVSNTGHIVFTFENQGRTSILVTKKPSNILGVPETENATQNNRRVLEQKDTIGSVILRLSVDAYCENTQVRQYTKSKLLIAFSCKKKGYNWVYLLNRDISTPSSTDAKLTGKKYLINNIGEITKLELEMYKQQQDINNISWYAFCIFRTEKQEYGKLTTTVSTEIIKDLKIDTSWGEVNSTFEDDSQFYIPEANSETLSGGKL